MIILFFLVFMKFLAQQQDNKEFYVKQYLYEQNFIVYAFQKKPDHYNYNTKQNF